MFVIWNDSIMPLFIQKKCSEADTHPKERMVCGTGFGIQGISVFKFKVFRPYLLCIVSWASWGLADMSASSVHTSANLNTKAKPVHALPDPKKSQK